MSRHKAYIGATNNIMARLRTFLDGPWFTWSIFSVLHVAVH